MAASTLQGNSGRVVVLDKGTSVGGRMATRRIGPGRADHGAQFFTVRTDEFGKWVERWQKAGLVYLWARGWSEGSLRPSSEVGQPRFAVRGGMNALMKKLAEEVSEGGIEIFTDTLATAVRLVDDAWQVETENDQVFSARALLLTPPVPQSLALIDAGKVRLTQHDRTSLERIEYAPCLCGLFWVEGDVSLPAPGVLQMPSAPIRWIADNLRKGISPDARVITAHASPEFSREHWGLAESEALTFIQAELQSLLDPSARVRESQLKRWRYSLPLVIHPERLLQASELPPLVFAGDAFGGPRVEGAALSGLAAGHALLNMF